ncbi:MAG: hypothetical protein ACO1SV_25300 [Fimbriimonas sp.]
MRSESLVFLLVAFLAEAISLVLIARTPPREQPGAVVRAGLLLTLLLVWFGSLVLRGHSAPEWVVPFSISLVGTAVAWLLIDRRVQARHGLRYYPSGVRAFEEHGVSGRCLDSPATRLLGAAGALIVTITRDELWVRPGRTMPAAAMGLVHRIPLRRIHLMERLAGRGANIRLEYAGSDGWCRCVELQLRNPGVFIETVREGQLEGIE